MMDCNDVLEYATIAGAASALLETKTGTLSPGKQADIILLRTDMLNVMPINDMKTPVVLNMDARNVDTVMVAGKIVKQSGRMLGVDISQLNSRLYESRDRVFAASAVPFRIPMPSQS